MAASPNRTVRISEEEWELLTAAAKERGVAATELLLSGWLRPSLAIALETLDLAVVGDEDRRDTLRLADRPALAAIHATDLRAIASGLNALAARWPR